MYNFVSPALSMTLIHEIKIDTHLHDKMIALNIQVNIVLFYKLFISPGNFVANNTNSIPILKIKQISCVSFFGNDFLLYTVLSISYTKKSFVSKSNDNSSERLSKQNLF